MYTHPGKKLLFMGSEFGQGEEWDSTRVLDWYVLEYPLHQGVQQLVRTLNHLYRDSTALHDQDFDWQGFEWIDCHDAQNSVLIYQRKSRDEQQHADSGRDAGSSQTGDQGIPPAEHLAMHLAEHLVVALNFTPVPREGYRIGVPCPGPYREIFNSDDTTFGGSGVQNGPDPIETDSIAWMDRPYSLVLTLPPLGGIVLQPTTQEDNEIAQDDNADSDDGSSTS